MLTQTKRLLSIVLAMTMLTTTGAGVAMAQDMAVGPGEGPTMAVQPAEGMVTIAPNSWQWYIFRSQVPVNVDADGNDVVTNPEDATIDATLYSQSSNLDFEVWDNDDFNSWLNSADFDPLGRGTENDFMNDDPLFWRGSFEANNNYYLIVKNNTSSTASYMLDITGNVRFPSEMTLNAAAPTMADSQMMDGAMDTNMMDSVMSTGEMALTVEDTSDMSATDATMSDMSTTSLGTGPERALMPTDGNVTIAPNSWQWYAFRSQLPVNVDSDGNDVVTNPEDATIEAALRTVSGSVDFEVWSRNDLNSWLDSSDFDPLGRGTENDFMNGDPLFWKGSFTGNDVYYLIVQNGSGQPATYSLNITGDVSFPTSATLAVQ